MAAGVVPSKNVTQFFSIAAAAPVKVGLGDALAAGELAAADVAADDGEVDAAAVVGAVEVELVLLELLAQAVMVAATARPSTGTSRLRRAM